MNMMSKADYNSKQRAAMASNGQAMPDGSFPIKSRQDLLNAIQSVGRASNYAAAKKHIIARAKSLGLTELLPDDWKKEMTNKMFCTDSRFLPFMK